MTQSRIHVVLKEDFDNLMSKQGNRLGLVGLARSHDTRLKKFFLTYIPTVSCGHVIKPLSLGLETCAPALEPRFASDSHHDHHHLRQ